MCDGMFVNDLRETREKGMEIIHSVSRWLSEICLNSDRLESVENPLSSVYWVTWKVYKMREEKKLNIIK